MSVASMSGATPPATNGNRQDMSPSATVIRHSYGGRQIRALTKACAASPVTPKKIGGTAMREYVVTVSFAPRDIRAVRDALYALHLKGVIVTVGNVEVRDGI